MDPTNTILADLPALLAADTTTLAPATLACKLMLSQQTFTPNPALVVGDLLEATFDGYAALTGAVGTQLSGQDPTSGNYFTEMKIPVGGWRFATTGVTHLPQTIFGFALVDNAKAVIYGSALFPQPITLNAIGQVIEVDSLRFVFNPNAIS